MEKIIIPNFNFHQHSIFSDGKAAPEKYVEKAVELGFSETGFTEHSPLPFETPFSLKMEKISDYIKSVERLKRKYENRLDIYRALEMDFVPGMSEDFDFWRKTVKADYLIGSIHLIKPENCDKLWFTDGPDPDIYDLGIKNLFDNNVKKAVTRFYDQTIEMIETQKFEIIGHFDKVKMHNKGRLFNEDEKWYQILIDKVVDLIKQKNLIVEINTRGLYKKRYEGLFPDGAALEKVKRKNIPVIISSDAHKPDELNLYFDYAVKVLKNNGFKSVMRLKKGGWQEFAIV